MYVYVCVGGGVEGEGGIRGGGQGEGEREGYISYLYTLKAKDTLPCIIYYPASNMLHSQV